VSSIWFRLYVRILVCPGCVHDISCRLTHGERQSAPIGFDRNHPDTHEITLSDHLAWGRDPTGRDLTHVDEALEAHRHAGKRPVRHDASQSGLEFGPDSKLARGASPGILLQPLDR
jgi:hypothetical protein